MYLRKKIKIPIYTGRLVIIITNKDSKLPTHIQDNYTELYAMSYMDDIEHNRVGFHIVLNPKAISKITNGIIAHEISHCIDTIMDYHNIDATKINEPRSYLTGWITDQIYHFMKQNKIKIHFK